MGGGRGASPRPAREPQLARRRRRLLLLRWRRRAGQPSWRGVRACACVCLYVRAAHVRFALSSIRPCLSLPMGRPLRRRLWAGAVARICPQRDTSLSCHCSFSAPLLLLLLLLILRGVRACAHTTHKRVPAHHRRRCVHATRR